MDVSQASLAEARHRLALHGAAVELYEVDLEQKPLPIANSSVDLVHSSGVLHHLADPDRALRELRRVLKPGGLAQFMIYNRQSIWYHLYVPYVLQIEEGKFSDLPVDEAFRGSTDGLDCPISHAYRTEEYPIAGRALRVRTHLVRSCGRGLGNGATS